MLLSPRFRTDYAVSGSKAPARWPNYALWALEETQVHLTEIVRQAESMRLVARGMTPSAESMRLLDAATEISVQATRAQMALLKGKNGER